MNREKLIKLLAMIVLAGAFIPNTMLLYPNLAEETDSKPVYVSVRVRLGVPSKLS